MPRTHYGFDQPRRQDWYVPDAAGAPTAAQGGAMAGATEFASAPVLADVASHDYPYGDYEDPYGDLPSFPVGPANPGGPPPDPRDPRGTGTQGGVTIARDSRPTAGNASMSNSSFQNDDAALEWAASVADAYPRYNREQLLVHALHELHSTGHVPRYPPLVSDAAVLGHFGVQAVKAVMDFTPFVAPISILSGVGAYMSDIWGAATGNTAGVVGTSTAAVNLAIGNPAARFAYGALSATNLARNPSVYNGAQLFQNTGTGSAQELISALFKAERIGAYVGSRTGIMDLRTIRPIKGRGRSFPTEGRKIFSSYDQRRNRMKRRTRRRLKGHRLFKHPSA